jgi:hypothetical protein
MSERPWRLQWGRGCEAAESPPSQLEMPQGVAVDNASTLRRSGMGGSNSNMGTT